MTNHRRSALPARGIVPAILLSLFLGAPRPTPGETLDGRWLLDFDRDDGRIQLTIRRSSSHGNWNNSSSYFLADFRGLSRPSGTVQKPAHFEMVRDAGTIRFDGELDESGDSGRFRFAANPEFDKYWRALGYSGLGTDEVYSFTMHDERFSSTDSATCIPFTAVSTPGAGPDIRPDRSRSSAEGWRVIGRGTKPRSRSPVT